MGNPILDKVIRSCFPAIDVGFSYSEFSTRWMDIRAGFDRLGMDLMRDIYRFLYDYDRWCIRIDLPSLSRHEKIHVHINMYNRIQKLEAIGWQFDPKEVPLEWL